MSSPLKVTWWPNLADAAIILTMLLAQPFTGVTRPDVYAAAGGIFVLQRAVQMLLRFADNASAVPGAARPMLVLGMTAIIGAAGWLLWNITGPLPAVVFCWWLRTAAAKSGLRLSDVIPARRPLSTDEGAAEESDEQPTVTDGPLLHVPAYQPRTLSANS